METNDEAKGLKPKKPNFVFRFFRFFFSLIRSYFISVGVFATLVPLLLIYALTQQDFSKPVLSKSKPEFGAFDKFVINFELDQRLSDKAQEPSEKFFGQLLGEEEVLELRTLITALRRAKEDIRVQGVFVELGDLRANRANLTELRQAFVDFKASQKALHVHLTNGGNDQYYLASVADKISLAPTEQISLPGPVFQLTYYQKALEKLGVDFEVIRAGKFKSALEPFVENQPSEATLEMYNSMEKSLVQHFVDHVSTGRKKTADEVRVWLKKSFFSAKDALDRGMVDQIVYLKEAKKAFLERFPNAYEMSPKKFIAGSHDLDGPLKADGSDKIGYIEAFGTIVPSAPKGSSDPMITPENMANQVEFMMEDENIKAVVLRVVSPGGSATASDEIWHAMKELAAKKPLVVSMGGVAASGGYYIAAPAKKIFADPTTITGSIGVIAGLPNFAKMREKWGLSFYTINSSERKNIYDPGTPLSEKDKEVLAALIDDFYQTFLQKVAEGRKQSVEEIHKLAQGRVYTGAEALGLGLVDHLGGLGEAFREAKKLAGLQENKLYEIATYRRPPRSALDCLGLDPADMIQCFEKLESWVPDMSARLMPDHPLEPFGLGSLKAILQAMSQDQTLFLWPGAFAKGAQCYQVN